MRSLHPLRNCPGVHVHQLLRIKAGTLKDALCAALVPWLDVLIEVGNARPLALMSGTSHAAASASSAARPGSPRQSEPCAGPGLPSSPKQETPYCEGIPAVINTRRKAARTRWRREGHGPMACQIGIQGLREEADRHDEQDQDEHPHRVHLNDFCFIVPAPFRW